MKDIDYNYTNAEGFSINDILAVLTSDGVSKKDIITKLSAKKSIDSLLNKLLETDIVVKDKVGSSVLFKLIGKVKKPKKVKPPVDQHALEYLEKTLASIPEKKSKKIVHKSPDKKPEVVEILPEDEIQIEEDVILTDDNPYRFVLDFFNSKTEEELTTDFFRRRDDYAVKSIYNKLKSMCVKMDDYNVDQQNVPFYRAFSVNFKEKVVKILHIDMNRSVRGIHNVFGLTDEDINLLKKDK